MKFSNEITEEFLSCQGYCQIGEEEFAAHPQCRVHGSPIDSPNEILEKFIQQMNDGTLTENTLSDVQELITFARERSRIQEPTTAECPF